MAFDLAHFAWLAGWLTDRCLVGVNPGVPIGLSLPEDWVSGLDVMRPGITFRSRPAGMSLAACTHKTLCNVARGESHPNNSKGTMICANTEHACTCTALYCFQSVPPVLVFGNYLFQISPKSLNLAHLKVQHF